MATEEETTQGVFFRVELELGKERKVHFWLRERRFYKRIILNNEMTLFFLKKKSN